MKTLKTAAALVTAMLVCVCASGSTRTKKAEDKSASVTELTSDTFKTTICDITKEDAKFLGDRPAIVDFTATWCGPCRKLAPILEELSKEYKGKVDIYKVDVDKCSDLAKAFRISSIPALLFIPEDGTPQILVGLRSKEALKKDIDTILLQK